MSRKLNATEIKLLDEVCPKLQEIVKMNLATGEPEILIEYVMGSYLKAHYKEASAKFKVPKFNKIRDHLKYPWPKGYTFINPRERLERALLKGRFDEEVKKHMRETEVFLKFLNKLDNTKNSNQNENNEKNQTSSSICTDGDDALLHGSADLLPKS